MRKIAKYIFKHLDICILIVTSIIAGLLFCLSSQKSDVLIAILGIGISIAFSVRQYKIENDKIFKELFIMYNDKYDRKFNNCLNQIAANFENDVDYKLVPNEKVIVIDYLNMCAEEYLWFTKGRIDSTAWKSWKRGMKYYLELKPIKQFVNTENSQKDSYYGIFEYLKL